MAILTQISHDLPRACCGRRRNTRWVLCCALLLMGAGWFFGVTVSAAEEQPLSEYQLKAAFLINFPKYADWPSEKFAETNSPIVIAVAGDSKVSEEVQKLIPGRTVRGRELVLKRLASGGEPAVCHILFIPAAEQEHSRNLLSKLKGGGVLKATTFWSGAGLST